MAPCRSAPFLALLAVSLSACAPGGVRVTHPEIRTQYSRSEVFYALGDRDTEVVVNGSPFAGAPAERATTDVMNRVPIGPRTNFTTTPGETARRPYRVVLAYAPAVPLTGSAVCAQPRIPTRPPGGEETSLQGAFCHGPNLLSAAYATAGPLAGPDDPAFPRMVAALMRALFPPSNPESECSSMIISDC